MSKDIQEALLDCIARVEAGADVEAILAEREDLAGELRPLLEAAIAVREMKIEPYSREAFRAGKSRLSAVVAEERLRGNGASVWHWPPMSLRRGGAIAAMALVVAVVAFFGLATDVFRSGTTTTQADVQGFLSAINEDELRITTPDGLVTIRLSADTRVLDAQGQPLPLAGIVPGGSLIVSVDSGDDGVPTALEIEIHESGEGDDQGVEVEFSGTVVTMNEATILVEATFGTAVLNIEPETKIKGTVIEGVFVEVEGTSEADGSFTASEITVVGGVSNDGQAAPESGDGDDGGGHEGANGGSSSGSGGDDDDGGSSSSSGGGDDDDSGSSGGSDGDDDDDGGSSSGSSGDDDDNGGSSSGPGGDDDDDSGSSSGSGGDDDDGSNSGSDDDDQGSDSGSHDDDAQGSNDGDDGDTGSEDDDDKDSDSGSGDDGGSDTGSDDGDDNEGSSGDDDGSGDGNDGDDHDDDDGNEPSGGDEDKD